MRVDYRAARVLKLSLIRLCPGTICVTIDVTTLVTSRLMKRAFTLIELLVVIAIISILAAILFPVFSQAKQSAKQIQCLSNMKQIGMAAMMYLSDNDDQWFGAAHWEPTPGFAPMQMWIGYDNNNYGQYGLCYGRVDLPATHPPGLEVSIRI